jgi:hypothetical protein
MVQSIILFEEGRNSLKSGRPRWFFEPARPVSATSPPEKLFSLFGLQI